MNEYEFLIVNAGGDQVTDRWHGQTMEQAAKRILAARYPGGRVIAWRSPSHVVTTTPIRGC